MRQTDGICRNYSPANSVCGFIKNLRINAAISNGGSEHRRYFHRMPGRRRLQSHGQLPAFHKQRWTLCPVQWYRPPFSAWPTDQRLRPAHSGHDNTHHSALDCFRHGLKKSASTEGRWPLTFSPGIQDRVYLLPIRTTRVCKSAGATKASPR